MGEGKVMYGRMFVGLLVLSPVGHSTVLIFAICNFVLKMHFENFDYAYVHKIFCFEN